MPVMTISNMTIGTNSLKEEMAAMTIMLERRVKESEEKEAYIQLQEEKIAKLTKKEGSGQPVPSQKTQKVRCGEGIHPK